MDASIKFWNGAARKYAQSDISNVALYEKKLALTQKYFTPETQVMEYGCGTGSTALIHAPHVGNILGLDSSSEMIEICHERLAESEVTNASFKCGTVFDTETDNLDVILALNVLHLIPDYPAAIAETFRLLKPGGVFISGTVCLSGFTYSWLRPVVWVAAPLGFIPKVIFLSKEDVNHALTAAGFNIEETLPDAGRSHFVVARKPA